MHGNTWLAVVLVLLLSAGGAAAQTNVEVELGGGAIHAHQTHGNETSATGYVGGSVVFADRIAAYGALHPGGDGGLVRAGVEWRLGPAAWLVRPALRVGVFDTEPVFVTGGAGLRIGRRAGGRSTVDWTRNADYELSYVLLNIGAYYTF